VKIATEMEAAAFKTMDPDDLIQLHKSERGTGSGHGPPPRGNDDGCIIIIIII